ncbi:MAG: DUF4870 domain-containing protein [Patescibacteria group bacterium]
MNEHQNSNSSQPVKPSDEKTNAFLTTFLSIIGFAIAMSLWKENKYVMFYAKQSLAIFIIWVAVWVVCQVLNIIPLLGWLISICLNIALMIVWLMSWLNALSGTEKRMPLISDLADKLNF